MKKLSVALTLLFTSLSFASIPETKEAVLSGDSIYETLHDVKITPVKELAFDSDISKLSAQEKSHRLPMRLKTPMERIDKTPYRPEKAQAKPSKQPRWSNAQAF